MALEESSELAYLSGGVLLDGLLLDELDGSGGSLGLVELLGVNTLLEGLVEERVEAVGVDTLVVGLDVLLEGGTAVREKWVRILLQLK